MQNRFVYEGSPCISELPKIYMPNGKQGWSKHISQNVLLSYGFREGKSADDALLQVTSLLEQARRQEKHAVLISLDISGAFDSLQYSSIRDRFASLPLFSTLAKHFWIH
ncbi:hypothetical protein AVEN_61127-1 [Araneus ventricosus]|uniref:Uncharacterized protein n=1 Tax=Araneus ventricosus TaxID=182803 RepID=A0A4Y2NZX9_ARAVE|nr:hypothetical protein AVEN_61127-1 [Araneus ventricosus]